jgi:hypothetical protein
MDSIKKVPYCDCFQQKWSKMNKNSFLAKSNFSSKNFARTFWKWSDWGGKTENKLLLAEKCGTLSYWSIN